MLISAKIVKPRKFRICCTCHGMIVTKALRLYGGRDGDKPSVLYEHPACCRWSHPKIQKLRENGLMEDER